MAVSEKKGLSTLRKIIPDVIILLVFILASAIYFYPALQGKIVYAGDNVNGTAACREGNVYKAENPDGSWWVGSIFCGMPNYQVGGHGDYLVDKLLKPIRYIFTLGLRNSFFIFLFYLCVFYLLLRSFDIQKWLSMAGAFAIAMSSYFFVIIAAQHLSKCYTITWITPVVVGFILLYRKKYALGAIITAFFTYLGLYHHPQMAYYICMMLAVFFCAELAIAWKDKQWKHFGIATALFVFSFALGMGMGSANMFVNQEYVRETMRGGHSDLDKSEGETKKSKGLNIDYATAWSEGIGETLTLLVPNYMGGATGYNLGEDSQLERDLIKMGVQRKQARQFAQQAPVYWGEKPFTSGPVYVGAIICMLFLLGLIIVPGPYKWAILVATIFSVLLSWGRNFMWLTELFFNYFPMYNKFRAVESILVVAEITMPLLGFLGLREIVSGRIAGKQLRRALYIAGGITGGICLFIALFGGSFDVTSSYDAAWKGQVGEKIYDAILAQRHQLMRADAWRSLLFIALGMVAVFVYDILRRRKSANIQKYDIAFAAVLTLLIVADMWQVDKRFCNDSMFVTVKERDKAFRMLPYEEQILQDKDYFRVLNLATNTFNEARTSYYLKSIGGYSAAKMRRYQDLIDVHISQEMNPLMRAISSTAGFRLPYEGNDFPVLNMLNMRYAIVPLQDGSQTAIRNPYAMGNAWFVDSLVVANTPNEEIEALDNINLHTTAVIDKSFMTSDVPVATPADEEARIDCVSYKPDVLQYTTQSSTDKVLVFSEIYYPNSWKVYVDEALVPLYRVNYLLRAIVLPSGNHSIRMEFRPNALAKGNTVALVCFVVFVLMLLAAIAITVLQRKRLADVVSEDKQ